MATHFGGSHELGLMADGYKRASDILVHYLEQHERNDSLVYPIIFGYRQYLELQIKALAIIVNRCDYLEETYKRIHDLQELWSRIRQRLWENLEDDERAPFQTVESVIGEFQSIDPKSDGFRFPSEIKQFNINLGNMRQVMDRVSVFLDSLIDWWHAGLQAMPDTHDLA